MDKEISDRLDLLALKQWGRTRTMALNDKICVKCGCAPDFTFPVDEREYNMSGLCATCFNDMFTDPEEDPVPPPGA